MKVILQRPDGTRYTIDPGASHPSSHTVVGVENVNQPAEPLSKEDNDAIVMLHEIETELGGERGTGGDWIGFFAKPIAIVLDKDGCLSCEFRRVCLNCGKKLRRIYGPEDGKKKMKALIMRSFTDDPSVLGRELKELLK